MNKLPIDFPATLLGWITLITIIVVAAAFIFYTWRNQSLKLLRESVDDLKKRVEIIEAENKRLCEENRNLTAKYAETKFKKNYLKQLVVEALASKKDITRQILEEVDTKMELQPR